MPTKLYDIKEWCKHGSELEDYPYIGEIDGDADLSGVIKIGNQYYIAGIINHGKHAAGVRVARIDLKPHVKEYESNIVCPYCGYEDANSWEQSSDNDEIECGRCGATIEYTRVVTVEYTISAKKPPKIVNRKFI